jgi:hypothetical protein
MDFKNYIKETASGFSKKEIEQILDLMLDGGLNSVKYDPERDVNHCPVYWGGMTLYMKVWTHYKSPKWDDGEGHTGKKWCKAKLETCDRQKTIELWKKYDKKSLLNLNKWRALRERLIQTDGYETK